MEHLLLDKLNYWIFILLMMLGLWAMVSKNNLIKKVMGMNIFQAAIILFYVSIGAKESGADIPIYPHDLIHPEQHDTSHDASGAEHHDVVTAQPLHSAGAEPEGAVSHDLHKAEGEHANINHASETHAVEQHVSEQDHHGHPSIAAKINPDDYDNPLPHVLMLTAIVVGVATLGVALALIQRIYRLFGSIEESEIIAAIAKDTSEEHMANTMQNSHPDTQSSHA